MRTITNYLFTILLLVFVIGSSLAKAPASFADIPESHGISYSISNVNNRYFKGIYLFALSKGSLVGHLSSFGEQRNASGKAKEGSGDTPIDYLGTRTITSKLKRNIEKFTFSNPLEYKCQKSSRFTDVVIKVTSELIPHSNRNQKTVKLRRKFCMTQKAFSNSVLFAMYKSLPLKKLSIMANAFRNRVRNYSVENIIGTGANSEKALTITRAIAKYRPFRTGIIPRKPADCKKYLRKGRPSITRFKYRRIRTLYYNPSLLKSDKSCYIVVISNTSSVSLYSVLTIEGKHVGTYFWDLIGK